MIKVSKIDWLGGHRLRFRFNDDSVGEMDFAALVNEPGPMAEPLRDPAYFKRVLLDHGAPTWPNGFDVAPAWLYRELDSAGGLVRASVAS
jgi:hypothetical protein